MKCSKCGSEVRPNYKFCTKCGQPMENPKAKVPSIERTLDIPNPESSKGISTKPVQALKKKPKTEEENIPALEVGVAENLDIVRGKAIWSIGPGQLARRVSEVEFAQLDKLKGVVIQEGVVAVITVDGKFMAMLDGGFYEFATQAVKDKAQEQANKEEKEDKETEGILSKVGNIGRRVWRFLTGTKNKEKAEERKKRRERVKRNIQRITAKSAVNVTLVSTRVFELLFGSNIDGSGRATFVPITVKTKVVDLDMGVSLQMQIVNINEFLVNYLSDHKSFSVADAQAILLPSVKNLFDRVLRNFEYEADGLPEDLVKMLGDQIKKTINERAHGMEVVRILDITDQSADFDRFRAVEHELFASEYELGFLQRTGEFRNRLAEETNAQTIQEAKTEEDLRYALSHINRDGLLHDDEMEAFVELLNSQKRLREAKTEEQEYEALQDLRKCRLLKDEDMAVIEHMLSSKQMERGEATELLRLRIFQTTEEARVRADNALSDLALQQQFKVEDLTQEHSQASERGAAQHSVEMTDLELQAQRKADEYTREQKINDYDFERRRRLDEMGMSEQQAEFERQQRRFRQMDDVDALERKAAIARENMAKMQEHERKLEEMKHQTESLRIQTEANMTQEQIAAAHMRDIASLDTNAQAEMAKMMGSSKHKEAEMLREQQQREKEWFEKMMQMMQANQQGQQQVAASTQEQMMQMMQMMTNGMTQMGHTAADIHHQRYDDMRQQKDEYRENARYQQNRMDHTQDRALEFTAEISKTKLDNDSKLTVITNDVVEINTVFCPACGGRASSKDTICPHCGEPLEQ